MDIDHETETVELTHEDCLDYCNPESTCEGEVGLYASWNSPTGRPAFPRCDKHYDEYLDRCEARDEREREYQASLYCKHGTYVGDAWGPDYLCGACESE